MNPGRRRALVVSAAVGGGLLLLVAVGVIVLAAVASRVSGTSMEPTLHNGDRLIVTPSTGHRAHRFDVIITREPRTSGTEIVKRVIAVPGDAIEIRGGVPADFEVLLQPGHHGPWYQVDEPIWRDRWTTPTPCCDPDGSSSARPTVRIVPVDRFFVMGDNPSVSIDSRTFGWVSASMIEGRVGLRVWPLSASRSIGNRPHLVLASDPPTR